MKIKPTESDERFGAITMPTKPGEISIRRQVPGPGNPATKTAAGPKNPGQKDYRSLPRGKVY